MEERSTPESDSELDLSQLLHRYLQQRAHPYAGSAPPILTKFVHGQSNPTYLVRSADEKVCVFRKKPSGRHPSSAHAVDREYEVQQALHGRIPVPRMILLERDPCHIGTSFYLMEFVRGSCYHDAALPAHTLSGKRAIYE